MTPTQAAHIKALALKASEASAQAMRAALQDSDPAAANQVNRDAHAFLNKAIDQLTNVVQEDKPLWRGFCGGD